MARFIGSPAMNILPCKPVETGLAPRGGRHIAGSGTRGNAVKIGVRPENLETVAPGEDMIDGTVEFVEYLGADSFLILSTREAGQITVRTAGTTKVRPGDEMGLAVTDTPHFFDEAGRTLR